MGDDHAIRAVEDRNLEVPEAVKAALVLHGGTNRFGEPNYRIVWGWKRLSYLEGVKTLFDEHGNITGAQLVRDEVPRYHPRDRFWLEVWIPPEAYGTPDTWQATTQQVDGGMTMHTLGEFPYRGDYEAVTVCQGKDGEFVMPTAQAAADIVKWHMRLRHRTSDEIKNDIEEEMAAEEKDRIQKYHDIIDSEAAAFPWKTWVPMAGQSPRRLIA